jgi:multiple sugar transport system ATP-binding protein
MASLSLDSLHKRYGRQPVLRGVSLDIADGEFVALVGPSGCGKSTLLRLIAGLEPPDAGTLRLGGRDITRVAPKDRNVAMVFQNYALYPHMTVARNLGFALKLQGLPAAEIDARVRRVAQTLEIGALLERKPGQLSGGQRQRVAMGRAIVRDPQAFLFDEPLSNLDAQLRVQMRIEIKALHQRLRTTTVYVTHDQVEAMTMADRIVVLRDGTIEQVGTPLELYDRPANAFVARFIGSPAMNLLEGRVEAGGAQLRLDDGALLPLPPAPVADGQRVLLGVRPEHVELAAADGGDSAEVLVVEPTGSDTHVALRQGRHEIVVALRERSALRPGDRLRWSAAAEHGHLFDAESGVRLG